MGGWGTSSFCCAGRGRQQSLFWFWFSGGGRFHVLANDGYAAAVRMPLCCTWRYVLECDWLRQLSFPASFQMTYRLRRMAAIPMKRWSKLADWSMLFFISLPPNFRDCRIFSRTEGVSTTDIVNRWVWVAAVASFRFPFVSACCFAAAIVIFVKSTECSWWPETTTIKPTPSRQRCRSRQSRFAK